MKNETLARFMWKLQTESGFTSPPPKNKKRGTFAARRESAIEGEKKMRRRQLCISQFLKLFDPPFKPPPHPLPPAFQAPTTQQVRRSVVSSCLAKGEQRGEGL